MKSILSIACVAFLGLMSCTGSHITTSWKSPGVTPGDYKKILVIGLINEPDRTIRETMESNLVEGLKKLHYDAVCSCDEYNPKTFEGLTEKEALSKINTGGIDAVITIVLLNKEKERYYVPGRVQYTPYFVYNRHFYGYYNTMYMRVYAPGYYVQNEKYFWETNFYAIDSTTQLLYSSQSQSFDEQYGGFSAEYAQMVIKDMLKSNVIRKKP